MMRGSDYAELAAFVAVAQEGNFRRASVRLGMSASALSHVIRMLEERLGVRLFNRTTRSVALTDAGKALLDRVRPAFGEIAQAVEQVGDYRARPAGKVRLNMPRAAAEIIFVPQVAAFAKSYPDVTLELTADDRLLDIVAGGFDAGIRPGRMIEKDMIAVRLTPELKTVVVGSPDYFSSRPQPRSPADLAEHACINYRWSDSGALYRWPLGRGGDVVNVAVEGPVTFNDSELVLSAAIAGAGLACSLEAMVAPHVQAGRLIRVLDEWAQPFPAFYLYHPSRHQTPPALRAVIDFFRVKGK
jgi:DNA-binding transcriptional LysR family regulator